MLTGLLKNDISPLASSDVMLMKADVGVASTGVFGAMIVDSNKEKKHCNNPCQAVRSINSIPVESNINVMI